MKNVKSEREKEQEKEEKKEEFPKEPGQFGRAHKRWLVREIESERMSIQEALERFDFQSNDPRSLIQSWRKRYAPGINVSLPEMTEKERRKQEALLKRMKALEKELEDAQMKNVALETLIDVAEEHLKISIRKKAGVKQ